MTPAPQLSSPSLWHYGFIREDIPEGHKLAQTGHAFGETAGGPLPEDTAVVHLGLPSEGAIRHMSKRLTEAGIEHKLIVEPHGRFAGQAMAIGCKPMPDRTVIRKLTSSLPLAGKPKKFVMDTGKERCDFFGECYGGCSVCAQGTATWNGD